MSELKSGLLSQSLAVVISLPVLLMAIAGRWRLGGRKEQKREPESTPTETPGVQPPSRLGPYGLALRETASGGQREALLRQLDRDLPEWSASSTLIEAVRELFALETSLAAARATGALETIINRLTDDIRDTSDLLWRRAERLVAAGAGGIETPRLREDMAREDDQLERLRASIRETRAGLAEMAMTGDDHPDAIGRAERRFRVLSATAHELQEMDRASRP